MEFLTGVIKLFKYYRSLADSAIAQLEPRQLFVAGDQDTNSIAVIMRHLAGNMQSRWTDFLTSDGEKPWRDRDGEFNPQQHQPDAVKLLMANWAAGWDCLFTALESLTGEDLDKTVYIRNEGQSVMDAITRQLAHYPYHVGQIVYAAKMLKDGAWESLSIARNQSADYNNAKFSADKHDAHFTDNVRIGTKNQENETN